MATEKKSTSANTWIGKITAYEREFKEWESRVEKIIKRYKAENRTTTGNSTAQFNILWSNVQTMMPAVFARLPKPEVSRRFRDNDPVGRVASMIIERGLEYEIDHYQDYRAAMKNSVQDRFLGGRGISWVRYEPHLKPLEAQGIPDDGLQITEDADESETEEAESQEEIDYECAPVDYVNWKDFGHTYARTWEEVTAIWRRVFMDRQALIDRFGDELGNQIPLDTRPEDEKKESGGNASELYQACIYEIWNKTSNSAIWVSKSMPNVLDEREDPLKLESFWPCPRPLYSTLTTNSLIPVPDFLLYQDQAISLDLICERIDKLIQALQVKGVHDAAVPELARLFTEAGNTDLIPVANWSGFAEKNGLRGAIDIVDLTPIVNALNAAYTALGQVKNEIYEIMGIADILRGASDPDETLGAQRMKGQFGGLRLKAMRGDVEQYATEILQIKAQIMCTMYQPETLVAISSVQQMSQQDQALVPQAIELIKNQPMRNFRIEISSDSMVQMDENQEKADRMEYLKASGGFLQNLVQVSQSPAATQLLPLAVNMMKYGVTAFKVGKSMEGEFDQAVDAMKQAAAQSANTPKPPPPPIQIEQMRQQGKMQEIQANAQIEQMQSQQEFQLEQQRMAMEAQARQQEQRDAMMVEQHKQEVQAREVAQQNQLEAQRSAMQAQQDAMLDRQRMAHESMLEQTRQQFELLLARLDHANKIDVAEVSKSTTLESAQIAAANRGAQDDSTSEPTAGKS